MSKIFTIITKKENKNVKNIKEETKPKNTNISNSNRFEILNHIYDDTSKYVGYKQKK
jgi:hypothetical protein